MFTYFLVGEDKSCREKRRAKAAFLSPIKNNSNRDSIRKTSISKLPSLRTNSTSNHYHSRRQSNNNRTSDVSLLSGTSSDEEEDTMTSVNSFLNGSVKYVKDGGSKTECVEADIV